MRRALLCLAGYLFFAAGILWPAPFGGEVLSACAPFVRTGPFPQELRAAAPDGTLLLGDAMHQFEPWLRYAADAFARTGRIPLWKDSNLCGAPLLANAQSALLWPPNLVAIVCGAPAWLLAWMAMAKFATAALGACLLARHLGVSPLGSFLSGAVFAFGGFQVLSLLHPHTNVSALLPWLLLCADRAALQPSGRRVAAVALVTGLQHLGGHPETAFHCQVLASVLVLGRASSVAGGAARALSSRSLLYPLAGLLLGAGLAALQLLPFLEYLRLSDTFRERSGSTAAPIVPRPETLLIPLALAAALLFARRVARGVKPALAALGLFAACTLLFVSARRDGLEYDPVLHLAPDWFGGHADFRGVGNYMVANSGYAGAALALAILGLIDGRPRSVARVAAGVLVLGALVGRNVPLVTPLLERLPPFDVSVNTRLQLLELIALALLAGLGLDRLGVAGLRVRFIGAMAAFATAAIVALSISIARGDHQPARVIGAVRRAQPMPAAAIEPARAGTAPPIVAGWVAPPSAVTSAVLLFGRARSWTPSLVPVSAAVRAPAAELARVPESAYSFRAESVEGLPAGAPYRVLCIDAEGRSWLSSWLDVPLGFPTWLLAASIPEGTKSPIELAFLAAAVVLVVFACAAQGRRLQLVRVTLVILGLGSLVYFAYDIPPTVPPELFYPRSRFIDDIARLRPDGRGLVFADDSLALRSEIGAAYHLLEPTGYDAMAPARVVSVLRAATADEQQSPAHWMLPTRLDVDRRLLGLMAVRAFAHSEHIPVAGQELWSSEPGLRLTANEDYRPRARLASSSIVESDDTRALAWMRDPEFDADTVILSRAPREAPGATPERIAAGAGQSPIARVAVDESDRVEVDVSGNEGGFLVLADTDFPGWTARVDGVEREVIRANVAFRAVAVRPGDRVVSFEYRPASFRIGCVVSLLCGLSLIALSMRSRTGTNGKPA
jgi:hypothetical protein